MSQIFCSFEAIIFFNIMPQKLNISPCTKFYKLARNGAA